MDNNKINFDNYIAKTYKIDDVTYFGRSVLEHCVIVGEVCKAFCITGNINYYIKISKFKRRR